MHGHSKFCATEAHSFIFAFARAIYATPCLFGWAENTTPLWSFVSPLPASLAIFWVSRNVFLCGTCCVPLFIFKLKQHNCAYVMRFLQHPAFLDGQTAVSLLQLIVLSNFLLELRALCLVATDVFSCFIFASASTFLQHPAFLDGPTDASLLQFTGVSLYGKITSCDVVFYNSLVEFATACRHVLLHLIFLWLRVTCFRAEHVALPYLMSS